jgi:DNA-binding LacI/PurR family transcriptional regulator
MDADGKNRVATAALDNEAGSRLATRHLAQLGHSKIACISGLLAWRCGRLRQRAWQRTLQALRLAPGPVVEGDWSAEGGYHATRKLLEIGRDNFSAIVVSNDQMALGSLRALHEAGIEVPAQVSLVGFDNIPEAAFLRSSPNDHRPRLRYRGSVQFGIPDPDHPRSRHSSQTQKPCTETGLPGKHGAA